MGLTTERKRERKRETTVWRWHSLQEDIQFWIKHTMMTECFSQQGRNVALGGDDIKAH